ncbi:MULTISPECIES: DUF4230 domain-containing protein [Prevotella]|uniref:DUF4230 domain-containing protein n=2 Tax=Prevotella melaninogenica TaxID=28132 RepID=A0ABX7XU75_9BACT|nr:MULTISPECIES: DUF4230 domain-containing protein [Prevotella]ERJ77899.1 hypothetical protein HMPREF9148_01087 [Prevotella sp. F0091]QUB77178.1 DUF4230 domain-containing protein [Prevotella melaninogenica]
MKQLILILSFFILLAVGCTNKKSTEEPAAKAIDTIPMLVTQVQQCSRLYTTEYHIHKIVTHDDKMKLSGSFLKQDFSINLPLGDRRIAIPMDATLKAYIDLSSFSNKNIQRNGKELIVTLPDPKIVLTSTKIDHKEVKQFVALTRHNFTDAELTSYEAQGRKQIIASIPQMGIIEQAQESAARQLVPIFTAMGYKESDITISFRKKFTISDLGQVVEIMKKD